MTEAHKPHWNPPSGKIAKAVIFYEDGSISLIGSDSEFRRTFTVPLGPVADYEEERRAFSAYKRHVQESVERLAEEVRP